MSFLAPGSPENVVLAQNVNGRLRAEARMASSRAFLFRAIGAGVFLALAGVGAGAASYGYSYIAEYSSAADRVAAALQTALSGVTLKTKGEVTLTDNTLKLEGLPKAGGSMTPTQAQLGKDATPASKAQVNTSFTVFKQVPYMDGQIVTGWNFRPSEDSPFQQYCYFSRRSNEPKGQVEIKIDLAMDGKVLPQPVKSDVNLAILANNCVWHDGKSL